MGSQLLRVARASQQPPIEQVIASLQQLKYAVTARNGTFDLKLPFAEIEWNQNETLNIGLAISGGVDSMALASLCSRLQAGSGNPARLRFRAFVVDHGVRSTSKDEASSVAKILEFKKIPTSILKIQWPCNLDPKTSPKFESLARTFRFQALGRACRDHSINSLFLAHHEDDQAETLLMRLAKGHGKRGLQGMNVSAPIPECNGIYGVDRSGGKPGPPTVSETASSYLDSEYGGVMVHRPLLNFTKAQLRETCVGDGMPWFEDHTNADPRITMRNAIRHMYAEHNLPAALQKPSLLEMHSRLQKRKEEATQLRQQSWSSKIQVRLFDARLPLLSIQTEALTETEISDDQAVPMLLEVLRSTIQNISSVDDIEIGSLIPVLLNIFPGLQPQLDHCSGDQVFRPESCKFNKAGVQFTRHSAETPHGSSTTWILTPEKAYRNRAPYLRVLPNPTSSLENQREDPDSWHLWDGRYWINICNQASQVLCVQHLGSVQAGSMDVVEHNRKLLSQLKRTIGKEASANLADVRHALPTLTIEADGKYTGRILAFPTLGIMDDEYSGRVKCMVRYKKVESHHQ